MDNGAVIMAITTTNGKLAIMELDQDYEPGLPISPGTLGQDDQQQLLWGFPEILWGPAVALVYYPIGAVAAKVYSPGPQNATVYNPGPQEAQAVGASQ